MRCTQNLKNRGIDMWEGKKVWLFTKSGKLHKEHESVLACARALLVKPDFLFLDEATASLDPEGEEGLYTLLRARLPGAAILSIAHRPAVARFHDRGLRVADRRLAEVPI